MSVKLKHFAFYIIVRVALEAVDLGLRPLSCQSGDHKSRPT
jgi:hypothetical protein